LYEHCARAVSENAKWRFATHGWSDGSISLPDAELGLAFVQIHAYMSVGPMDWGDGTRQPAHPQPVAACRPLR